MKTGEKKKIVVVLGPTSSGKSAIAIKLAKRFHGEIISADSRQVYCDLNLGTGKVAGKWKKIGNKKIFCSEGIVHHLIDFRSPRGKYNVSHFQKDCNRLTAKICNQNKLPIICGGTGFWISAVIDDAEFPKVKPNPKLRKKLEKQSAQQLLAILKELDRHRTTNIDKKNKFRLIRAIEICQSLGKVPALNYSKFKIQNSKFLQIGIDWPTEKLDRKIKKRLQDRFKAGMLEEVKHIKRKYGLSWKKIQSFGLGYYWIPEYFQGNIEIGIMKEEIFRAERRYAKRQRTWFKRDRRIIWENNQMKIEQQVNNFLNNPKK